MGYIEHGKSEGANLLAGGGPATDKGYFIQVRYFAIFKNHAKSTVMLCLCDKAISSQVDMNKGKRKQWKNVMAVSNHLKFPLNWRV